MEVDDDALACLVRQLFSDGQLRDRESALRELAAGLGHQRLGHRVRSQLETGLRSAVRRGILQNLSGKLSIHCRNISDYEFSFLKTQFLPSMGRTWITRKEAAQSLARWLGFRRTGQSSRRQSDPSSMVCFALVVSRGRVQNGFGVYEL